MDQEQKFENLNLGNESDVEQKFVVPLLTEPVPVGLGFNQSDFHTKPDIRKFNIGKGKSGKLYYPDYIIVQQGLPGMIIEVKSPKEDLEEAQKEGRLYAMELNSEYSKGKNPCKYVMVTNGKKLILNHWDSEQSIANIEVEKISSSNPNFNTLVETVSKKQLKKFSERFKKNIRGNAYYLKPTYHLGGDTTQEELVGHNSFGSNLSLEYRSTFNPEEKEERKEVVRNAYVKSEKRESHVRPINRLIKGLVTPSQKDAKTIKDTSKPKELLDKFENTKRLRNEICLLVGSVGSGKSTFTEYLRQVALSDEVKKKTDWILVNLNNSPINQDLIYDWIIEKIIEEISSFYEDVDFNSFEFIKTIFASEIQEIKKGALQLLDEGTEKYKEELYASVKEIASNDQKKLEAILNYIYADRDRLPVIVLDNSDKGNREKQLLMFEVANWLRDKYTCLIFLPIRESTYDHYHNTPPLDTVVKDLVFRIDPPQLEKVIRERFRYMVRDIKADNDVFHYTTSNSFRVEVKKQDIEMYLQCIMSALFDNMFFKRLLTGLAGRNIRKGIEMFLDICKSGYISEDLIFKIRESEGEYSLPNHLVTRILLRGRRKYYHDSHSRIKNLFHSDPDDTLPDPFIRLSILRWLKKRRQLKGPNNVKGYHKIETLTRDLISLGHNEGRIENELENLVDAECIMTESQDLYIDANETITITPKGTIHLDLLRNLDYLSTVSEDTYFNDPEVSNAIANNIQSGGNNHLSKQSAYENSSYLLDYLEYYKKDLIIESEKFLKDSNLKELVSLQDTKEHLEKKFSNDSDVFNPLEVQKKFSSGTKVNAEITGVKDYGIFVKLEENAIGFIPLNQMDEFSKPDELYSKFRNGQQIKVEVLSFSKEHKKFDCKIAWDEMQKDLFS